MSTTAPRADRRCYHSLVLLANNVARCADCPVTFPIKAWLDRTPEPEPPA